MFFNLIIPLYRSKANLPHLKDFILSLSHQIDISEINFVDDDCPQHSGEYVKQIFVNFNVPINVVYIKPNVGSFLAIREAMINTDDNPSIIFSADQQESIETLVNLSINLKNDSDLVLGVRTKRNDPIHIKAFSYVFWNFFKKFVNSQFPKNGADIFALNNELRQKYIEFCNPHQNMLSELIKLSENISFVSYSRLKREVGKSSWSFSKRLNYAGDTFFLNSKLPITILYVLSSVGLSVSMIMIVLTLVSKLFEIIVVPGYATYLILMLLFFSFNFLMLALLGSYMFRIQKLLLNPLPRTLKIIRFR
jgi:hypothetical protein